MHLYIYKYFKTLIETIYTNTVESNINFFLGLNTATSAPNSCMQWKFYGTFSLTCSIRESQYAFKYFDILHVLHSTTPNAELYSHEICLVLFLLKRLPRYTATASFTWRGLTASQVQWTCSVEWRSEGTNSLNWCWCWCRTLAIMRWNIFAA